MSSPKWSLKEDTIIKEMYGKRGAAAIMRELPTRSWSGIRARAAKIGAAGKCPRGNNAFRKGKHESVMFIEKRDGTVIEVILSTCDLDKVIAQGRWHLTGGTISDVYVSNQKHILLHRFLLSAPKGMDVDHINGNTLLNTRENLRMVTRSENNENRETANANNKSCGIKNISWNRTLETWVVRVQKNGVTHTRTSTAFKRAVEIANEMRADLHKFKAR